MPVVFTSPFAGNGNVLGMVTVLLVPFACATLPLSRSILLLGGVAAMQVVAVSRTAMFAFAVVGAAVVLIKMSASLLWRLRFAYVAFVVGLCASFYPLFVKFSGGSFSLRGYVWEAGREAIRQAPVFGHGPNYWHLLADNALFEPNYSPHNGWYDLVVAVGLWGVVVIAAAVAVQLYSTRKEILPYLVTYYACVLAINMFESVYVPYHFVIIPFAALLPLMLYDPKPADDEEMERNFVAFKRTRTG
jgi:O-antigen ligase